MPSSEALVQSLDDRFRNTPFLTLLSQSTRSHTVVAAAQSRWSCWFQQPSIAGFLFFKASLSPDVDCDVLLEKASVAEQAAQQIPDQVRHRFISLEERRSAEGAIVAERKIEIWENRATGQSCAKTLRRFESTHRRRVAKARWLSHCLSSWIETTVAAGTRHSRQSPAQPRGRLAIGAFGTNVPRVDLPIRRLQRSRKGPQLTFSVTRKAGRSARVVY